jgi:phytoene dehydrogenase-like protein
MRIGKKPTKSKLHGWPKAGDSLGQQQQQHGGGLRPKHVSPDSTVGRLSADLVESIYMSKIKDLANARLEQYAADFLDYDEMMKEMKQQQQQAERDDSATAEMGADGTVHIMLDENSSTTHPPPPRRPIFYSQYTINEWTNQMQEVSEHFFSSKSSAGWHIHANAAKFERMLDERYGMFRPFIKQHPEVEDVIRNVQRKYARGYFSPLRKSEDSPIPKSTAVIILFMMHRGGMQWQITLLSALFFLVGLQPWAMVALVAFGRFLMVNRQGKAIGTFQKKKNKKKKIPSIEPYYKGMSDQQKQAILLQPVGTPLTTELAAGDLEDASAYDAIMIGTGPATLYTAALLSRAGRKVLVLSHRDDASGCLTFRSVTNEKRQRTTLGLDKIPFDIDATNIAKVSKQQQILAPALSTTNDYQGGIRFVQVGSQADGFAFEILSIPGVGTDSYQDDFPIVLTAADAKGQLMQDAATYLGDGWPSPDGTDVGNSSVGAYVNVCEQINNSAGIFYMTKILPESVNQLRSSSAGAYAECAIRYLGSWLNKSFPLNAHTRSLLAGIGMKVEDIRPSVTSMAPHVTLVSAAMNREGMHYPIGGPRALCRAFENVVVEGGGKVLTGAAVKQLLFHETTEQKAMSAQQQPQQQQQQQPEGAAAAANEKDQAPIGPRCVGVQFVDGKEIRFSPEQYTKAQAAAGTAPVVISMEGFIHTFVKLLPDAIREKYKVPRGLPALSESRPVFKMLFALKGSANDLSVTGADYYRLPSAARAVDEVDAQTGQIGFGEIGATSMWTTDASSDAENAETATTGDEALVDSVNKDPSEDKENNGGGTRPERRRKKTRSGRFETGHSWIHISFPSAKDPSFEERHGKLTTCVVTIEADDDFVQGYDTFKPKVFLEKQSAFDKNNLDRLFQRVKKDLVTIYPQLEDAIIHAEVHGTIHRGLTHNPERYAAKGIRADTPYPGLFMGGPDLTMGGSFASATVAGWFTANAVVGYSYIDLLFLDKNITSDIARFLEPPEEYDDGEEVDLAVPYTPPPIINADAVESEAATSEQQEQPSQADQ